MNLSFEERQSSLWAKLKGHIEAEIDLLRRKNDGMMDEATTANIRGRIAALKNLAALDSDLPTVVDD